MHAEHQTIRGTWTTWSELFDAAARIATEVGPARLIGLSHSDDGGEGVITVWSWDQPVPGRETAGRAGFRNFRGSWTSWHDLFADAARFTDAIGPERLIGLSHSESKNDGIVTVWYWE